MTNSAENEDKGTELSPAQSIDETINKYEGENFSESARKEAQMLATLLEKEDKLDIMNTEAILWLDLDSKDCEKKVVNVSKISSTNEILLDSGKR